MLLIFTTDPLDIQAYLTALAPTDVHVVAI